MKKLPVLIDKCDDCPYCSFTPTAFDSYKSVISFCRLSMNRGGGYSFGEVVIPVLGGLPMNCPLEDDKKE